MPALVRPRDPCGAQNAPGCTPARTDGWATRRARVGVGRGLGVCTTLRGFGVCVDFARVGLGVGESSDAAGVELASPADVSAVYGAAAHGSADELSGAGSAVVEGPEQLL